MRRYFRTFLAMFFCAVFATFFVAYPQAASLDAPDRGWGATSVTLTLFFAAGLLFITFFAALLAAGLRYIVGRNSSTAASSRSMVFLIGATSVAAVLMATPYGRDPGDVVGLGVAWMVSGGVGMLSVTNLADTPARIRWRVLIYGTFAAIGVGLAALVAQAVLR